MFRISKVEREPDIQKKEEMGITIALHHQVLQHQTCSLSEKEKECPPPHLPG